MPGKAPDWKSLVANAKPRTRSVRLCLDGDLLTQLAEAEAEAEDRPQTLAGEPVGLKQLREAVQDASVTFIVRGLPRSKFRALEAANAKKDSDGADDGWDMTTFPDALVRACLVTPHIEAGDPLESALTQGEFEALFLAALAACQEVDAVPLRKRG